MGFTPNATNLYDFCEQKYTTPQAQLSGDLVELPDGRVGNVSGMVPKSAGDPCSVSVVGVKRIPKAANINILRGGKVYWQRANSYASFTAGSNAGGFYIGRAVADSPASQTYVDVDVNVIGYERLTLGSGLWSSTAVKTAGSPAVTRPAIGTGYILSLDTTTEAQKIDAIPVDSVRVADGPIFEGRLTVLADGTASNLTIAFGLANGTNATAISNITQRALFTLTGNSLELNAQSTDGTNTTASTDTTVAAVVGTYNEFWIDARNPAALAFYIDGVQVMTSTTFDIAAATGPLFPLLWLGKTSNATTGSIQVDFLRVRTCD